VNTAESIRRRSRALLYQFITKFWSGDLNQRLGSLTNRSFCAESDLGFHSGKSGYNPQCFVDGVSNIRPDEKCVMPESPNQFLRGVRRVTPRQEMNDFNIVHARPKRR
jgi:hypothetical protein